MSAGNQVHIYNPYADRAKSGPIDFAGDDLSNAATARGPVRQASLLLRMALVATVLLAAVAAFAAVGTAPPKAHLSGTLFEQTIATGFMQPEQIAIDGNGNLYVADVLTNNVYEITPVNGVYVTSVLRANLNGPVGVAVDENGDVFIANSDSSQILKETLTPDGTYLENVVPTTGLGGIVFDLAVDKTGEVIYIADSFNKRIVVETLSNGQYTQSVLPVTGLTFPEGLALDVHGDVFIVDNFNSTVVEWNTTTKKQSTIISSGLSGPAQVSVVGTTLYIADALNDRIVKALYDTATKTYSTSTVLTGKLNSPQGVVADGYGNLFIADTNNERIAKDSTGLNGNFGPWPAEQKSGVATLTFTFDQGGKIGTPVVSTLGNKTAQFHNAGTGSCTKGATIATGKTCTIQLYFEGQGPGFFYGTAAVTDFSGDPLALAEITGIGVGPLPIFPGGSGAVPVGAGLKTPKGVAIDHNGNVYISDQGLKQVLKEAAPTSSNHSYAQTVVLQNDAKPSWLAVDSAGNLFINQVDSVHGVLAAEIVEESPAAGGGYTGSTVYGKSVNGEETATPGPIVVDRFDNLWIAFDGGVQEYSLVHGKWQPGAAIAIDYLPPGSNKAKPLNPISLAVDDQGNFYVGEAADGAFNLPERVVRYAPRPDDGGYAEIVVESGIYPQALGADLIGNVYVADNDAHVYSFSPVPGSLVAGSDGNSNSYTQTQIAAFNQASQLAVYGPAQLVLAESNAGKVLNMSWYATPEIDFPTTQVDTASTPLGEDIYNIGNANLTFTVPASGQNPNLGDSGEFALDSNEGDACPVLTASSEPAELAPGALCAAEVTFAPATVGSYNTSLIYTYTGPKGNAIDLGFYLAGKAILPKPAITWAAPSAISYGTALSATQLDATAAYNGTPVSGTFTYSPALGAVLNGGTQTLSVQFTPSGNNFSSASASVTIKVNPVPLVVVADSWSRPYGSPNPAQFTATYIGLVNGDTPASLNGAPAMTTEVTQQYPWGFYPIAITQGNLSSPNYTFTAFVDGTLEITQVPLTVTANNITVTNSSDIPNPYPCSFMGFVNSETAAVVSGACATNAQSYGGEPSGSYTVTPSVGTLFATNYYFATFVPGTLTISESQAKPVKHLTETIHAPAANQAQLKTASMAARKEK